jgi:hypothetical protein
MAYLVKHRDNFTFCMSWEVQTIAEALDLMCLYSLHLVQKLNTQLEIHVSLAVLPHASFPKSLNGFHLKRV